MLKAADGCDANYKLKLTFRINITVLTRENANRDKLTRLVDSRTALEK